LKTCQDIDGTIWNLVDWASNEDIKKALNTLSLINHTLKDFHWKPVKIKYECLQSNYNVKGEASLISM
jgi:hypothetical protein